MLASIVLHCSDVSPSPALPSSSTTSFGASAQIGSTDSRTRWPSESAMGASGRRSPCSTTASITVIDQIYLTVLRLSRTSSDLLQQLQRLWNAIGQNLLGSLP